MAKTKDIEKLTELGAEDLKQIRGGVGDAGDAKKIARSKATDLATDICPDWFGTDRRRKKPTKKKADKKKATTKG